MADDSGPVEFDLVILGGGPGGYAAALYGASAGMNIAMVEELRVGGTCLHRGCIPAKELLQTAEVLRTVRGAAEFGVTTSDPSLQLATSQTRKQAVVDRLTSGLESLLKGRKVTVVPGTGVLEPDGRTLHISDGTTIRGRNVLIATGSLPRELAVEGFAFDGERVLSSEEVLQLPEVPARVVVIGGGAIGCEFASFFVDAGSEVTILEVLPQILTGVDQQVAQTVVRAFQKRGIKTHTGVKVLGFDGTAVRFEGKNGEEQLPVDKVVVSVGRRPRSENAGLDGAGVKVDERGYIVVDGNMRTNVEGVYAVGDVVATPQLAHVAFSEAVVAIKTMLGESPVPLDYDKVPWGIYCHPEVAFCGLTEAQAKERGYDVQTSSHRWGGNGRALIVGETDGMVKIVSERDGAILGVHIAGPWATELIAEAYLTVNWEATPADVGLLIHAHPTLSELFGESVLALTGRSLHG
ncbi:MAG: dihydrolipoamide dehydrogenase [Actinomycetota bacterium]|jgi:dihydrolipoamide dehydrogenase|nr:dihydrolipoamide dehydrogenase [Actinomycetota bacterium]